MINLFILPTPIEANDSFLPGLDTWPPLPTHLALFSICITLCAIGAIFSVAKMSRVTRLLDDGEDAPETDVFYIVLAAGLGLISTMSLFYLAA